MTLNESLFWSFKITKKMTVNSRQRSRRWSSEYSNSYSARAGGQRRRAAGHSTTSGRSIGRKSADREGSRFNFHSSIHVRRIERFYCTEKSAGSADGNRGWTRRREFSASPGRFITDRLGSSCNWLEDRVERETSKTNKIHRSVSMRFLRFSLSTLPLIIFFFSFIVHFFFLPYSRMYCY